MVWFLSPEEPRLSMGGLTTEMRRLFRSMIACSDSDRSCRNLVALSNPVAFCLTLIAWNSKSAELEREPVEFDLELKPGAIDFGEEAEQVGESGHFWPRRGDPRASRAQGHRPGHPPQGPLCGLFSRFPARAASSRSRFRWPPTSTSSSVPSAPMPTPRSGPLQRRRPKSVIIKGTVCCLKMCCASRCFCPCRSGRCASPTARDFARAAERIAIFSPAPAMRVHRPPLGSADGLRSRIKS